jgi:hypothetical protein
VHFRIREYSIRCRALGNYFCEIPPMPFIQAPPGYQVLCDLLQIERDPARFRRLVELINRLLTAYEKSNLPKKHTPDLIRTAAR